MKFLNTPLLGTISHRIRGFHFFNRHGNDGIDFQYYTVLTRKTKFEFQSNWRSVSDTFRFYPPFHGTIDWNSAHLFPGSTNAQFFSEISVTRLPSTARCQLTKIRHARTSSTYGQPPARIAPQYLNRAQFSIQFHLIFIWFSFHFNFNFIQFHSNSISISFQFNSIAPNLSSRCNRLARRKATNHRCQDRCVSPPLLDDVTKFRRPRPCYFIDASDSSFSVAMSSHLTKASVRQRVRGGSCSNRGNTIPAAAAAAAVACLS